MRQKSTNKRWVGLFREDWVITTFGGCERDEFAYIVKCFRMT